MELKDLNNPNKIMGICHNAELDDTPYIFHERIEKEERERKGRLLSNKLKMSKQLNTEKFKMEIKMNTQNIKKAYHGKKGFYPSKKLQQMMRVKKAYIIDEAHFFLDNSQIQKMAKHMNVNSTVVTQDMSKFK